MGFQIPENSTRLKPFGIFGGGQLGYMLAEAARRMGLYVVLYCQRDDEPAVSVADKVIYGDWSDKKALRKFAETGIIGLAGEFENADPNGVDFLKSLGIQTYTMAGVLRKGRDRLLEKLTARKLNIPTAKFTIFNGNDTVQLNGDEAVFTPGVELIIKTRELGYDGKGQETLPDLAAIQAYTWKEGIRYIIEQKVDFAFECSVQVTRTPSGETFVSRAVRNKHTNRHGGGMLEHTIWHKDLIDPVVEAQAQTYADRLADGLELVGVITVEFFILEDGTVIFNEFAPRPHNSFHARAAGMKNQFDLYIAALLGKTLTPIVYDQPFIMVNLVGDQIYLYDELYALGFAVTDYRKTDSKPGRKMGHAELVFTDLEQIGPVMVRLRELELLQSVA